MGQELKNIIRVLVVDDSPLMCKVLTNILNSDPQIITVGVAHNGKEAVELVPKLKPDMITMDIHMPQMDGFEATREIMAYNPTPILIVSTSVFKAGMNKVFKAISYGALDVMEKGEMEIFGDKKSEKELIERIKLLSGIRVIHHPIAKLERKRVLEVPEKKTLDRIIAIACSTGGPKALLDILKTFPKAFPCGIVIVQHITHGFVEGLANWLDSECQIRIKVAGDSEEIRPGVAYLAPCDMQMRVGENGLIHLTNEAACDGHRPSGDVLLESVAMVYKEGAIGVILTGMGGDGAVGMKTIKESHGQTIAQDEKSCVIFGMPRVAIEMGAIDKVLSLENISEEIVRMLER